MMDKTARMDLSFFDSAHMGDRVREVRDQFTTVLDVSWLVFDIISAFINVAATLVIVCTYRWWLGLVTLVLLVPFMLYNKKRTERRLQMDKDQLRDRRKKDYYRDVFFDNNVQFELKLHHIGAYFIRKYKETWQKLYKINQTEEIRHTFINTLIMIVNVASEFLVLTVSVTATRAIPPVPAPSGAPAMPLQPRPAPCAPSVPAALPSTAMIFFLPTPSTPPWRNRRLRRCGRFGDRLSVPTLTYCSKCGMCEL